MWLQRRLAARSTPCEHVLVLARLVPVIEQFLFLQLALILRRRQPTGKVSNPGDELPPPSPVATGKMTLGVNCRIAK
jgi:hypothetical protein